MCARRWKTGNEKPRSKISMLVGAEMPVNERVSRRVSTFVVERSESRRRFLGFLVSWFLDLLFFFVVCLFTREYDIGIHSSLIYILVFDLFFRVEDF